jgi:biopolymer transport protein ExbD
MTPFVDIAFLILSFFIMATKFKPPETVVIETPGSVSSAVLPESNAVMISMDSLNRVFFTVLSEKDPAKYMDIIQSINTSQNLNLTPAEMANYKNVYMLGVPFGGLKQLLATPVAEQTKLKLPGIPVMDTLNNQLIWWIRAAKTAFAGKPLKYLIKGDNNAKYPAFESVIDALKKNDEFKYNLVTSLDGVPDGSELDKKRKAAKQ